MPSDSSPQTAGSVAIPLAWADMDAFGHVNNVVYFRWLETARIDFCRRLGWMSLDVPPRGVGVILHSVQCRFRIPLTFPDTALVTSRVTAIEPDRITLAHEVRSQARGNALAADGSGIIVAYDYDRAAKAPIPPPVLEALHALAAGS